MKGVDLHSLPIVDACFVALTFMEQAHPEEPKRIREYERMAKIVGIPIEEDPALVAERHRRQMEVVEAEFGGLV
jgi:hypothetical protein